MTQVNNTSNDSTYTYNVTCATEIREGARINSIYDINRDSYENALKADSKKNGGNGNGILDSNEMTLFNVLNIEAFSTGVYAANELNNHTHNTVYNEINKNLDYMLNIKDPQTRYDAIKSFFSGYNNDTLGINGFFEQIASEWGPSMTNGQAAELLKAIVESIPEGEKRYCDEYGTLYKAYKHYDSQPADEKFKNSPMAFITRIFGADRLDKLDEAIKHLYNE